MDILGEHAELPFRIGCVHLDHMAIAQRRVQLQDIVGILNSDPLFQGDLLLAGDFNSLSRGDYTDTQWRGLQERASEHGWAPPEAGDTAILTDQGFVDAAAEVETMALTAHVGQPLYRLDYVFHRGGLTASRATVPATFTDSDHYPLVVDFEHGGRKGKL